MEGGRGPWRITFDTNPDDCNLACVMCEEHSEFSPRKAARAELRLPHRRMDVEVIRRVVAEMAPLGLHEIIPSTMGEPLLYEQFEEIIDICRQYGVRLNLTTNGTWPRKGPTQWAELICPVTSDVKVSWNGTTSATQESIMPGSPNSRRTRELQEFLRVRDEIEQRGENRCRVTLQCTFMESNLDELPGLVRVAANLGIDRVKGHQLWVHFGQVVEQDLRRNADARRRWNNTVTACREIARTCPRADGSRVQLDNFVMLPATEDTELPADWQCPFVGQEAWVNWAGRFDPCCAPDSERRTLGDFGNVTSSGGLQQIWESPTYRTLVSDYRSHSVCRNCTLRRPPEFPH